MTPLGALGVAAAAVVVAVATACSEAPAASPWRHAYVVVAATAGGAGGVGAGIAAALLAILLHVPHALAALERTGATREALEALVTLGVVPLAGVAAGVPARLALRERRRHDALACVHAATAGDRPLASAIELARAGLAALLDADVVIVLRAGDVAVAAGTVPAAEGSPAAQAMATGKDVFVRDLGGCRAPRRAVAAPLVVGGEALGALVVERRGDLSRADRADVVALAAHVALAVAARLSSGYVAVASHELRTPLTAIHGFADLLATRTFDGVEVRRMAGVIRGETARLGRIVADFLDLARLERGQPPAVRREPVDVAAVLRRSVEVLRHAARGHAFEIGCPSPPPALDADPDALDRVLTNLVGNALKYAPPGTTVRLAVCADGDGVRFTVDDDGPGIPGPERERVFEPYVRAPGAATRTAGAGLGLAVARALVEAHGGRIFAIGSPTGGTRIVFTVPGATSTARPGTSAPAGTAAPVSPRIPA